jgi:biotin carboxyl carrier protein
MSVRPISMQFLALGFVVLALASCDSSVQQGDRESALAPTGKGTNAAARGAGGEVIVHVEDEAQERLGVVLASGVRRSMTPEFVAYGRVVADPSASFTVRAPIAGTLISSASSGAWPAVGAEIADAGLEIATIKPRLTAVERGDIATRLAAARGDLESSRAALAAAKSALQRTRELNAENKNASDRALEEAEARVKAEEARGAAAQASIETLQALLEPSAESRASLPVVVGKPGTIVDVLAHPGEAVDAGAVLLRLENFTRLQARVDMPIDGIDRASAETIRITAVGDETHFIEARRVAPAATVEVSNQGGSMLYAFEQSVRTSGSGGALPLRPGQAIVARIPSAGAPRDGFVFPRSAVLRFAGKAWIYDSTGEDELTRRPIELDQPTEDGWFVTAPWAEKAHVVVTGAASILSEEILGTQEKHAEEP